MYRLIVIKIGASVLIKDKKLNYSKFKEIAQDVSQLINKGTKVVIVSSGAIASGMTKLAFQIKPQSIPKLQALASLGQIELMKLYQKYFTKYNLNVGQVLLTWEDFSNRGRYLNAQRTLFQLLKFKIIPIINENDAVAIEEIKLGDNDRLSAMVASMINSDMLLILSDIDGIYDLNNNLLKEVENIKEIKKYCFGTDKKFCVGGMVTKLEAAEIVTFTGIPCIISNGKIRNPISTALEKKIGTFIKPKIKLKAKKHWLAYLTRPKGIIVIDSGAAEAVIKKGKSILPKGILAVKEKFGLGDLVTIVNLDGEEIARGITNYSSEEIKKIKGHRTSEIKFILGEKRTDEIIYRDNLVLIGGKE